MLSNAANFSIIKNNNFICFFYRRNSLSNNDFCCIRSNFFKSISDSCFSSSINSRSAVVKNKNLWFFQQSTGNTKPLLLTTRNIYAPLTKFCFITFRERRNKGICISSLTSFYNLFICSIFVTPFKVFLDSAGKKDILLQNHCNRIAKHLNVIITNIMTAKYNSSGKNIIQTRNKTNQRRF